MEKDKELKSTFEVSTTRDEDENKLNRNFSLWSTCALQYSLICSSIAIGTFLNVVVGVGGSVGLIYGFILAVTFDMIVCLCMAELSSVLPHSSAQIHWTYCLAPEKARRALSYGVGISACAGWILACFNVAYTSSLFIFALAQVYNPTYIPQTWHYYLVYCAIVLGGFLFNALAVSLFPLITHCLSAIVNGGTLFIIITLLVKASPKRSAEYVFTEIVNNTGWSSNGVVFFLSLLPSIATVTMFDGAPHMTDEIPTPERNIPLVMIISNGASALAAFISAIVYMFCIVSPKNMENPVGGQPFIQLMDDAFKSKTLTTIGTLILILTFIGSLLGYICSSSRLFWSFAKCEAFPFGKSHLSMVNKKFVSPINSLTFVTVIVLLLGLIMFGPSTALAALLGSSMMCLFISYVVPFACLLWASRCSMVVERRFPNDPNGFSPMVLNPKTNKPYFNLGLMGMPLNIVSIIWVIFITVWLCFPSYIPATKSDMNYASAVIGITLIIGLVLWFGFARRRYDHDMYAIHEI